jgi:predicted PurR-regulated permease PerM
MLGIDPRAARAAWTVFLVALLIATAYAIRETLVVLMIALLFAYLLMPLIGLVYRFLPSRISPGAALAIVYLILLGAIIAFGLTLGSRLGEEASSLATRLPDLLKNREWINTLPLPYWLEPVRARIVQMLQTELDNGGKEILPYVKSFGGQLLSGARYTIYIVLVPILSFFFLKDGSEMRRALVASMPPTRQRLVVNEILEDINLLLGKYIRALVLLAVSSFMAYSVFLGATGAQYAVLLACIAGLGEFLPVVGPAAAGVVALLVTGLSGYPHLGALAVFWLLIRLFQDYVVSPYVMGKGVDLNPLLVLFGVLAGEQIAGIVGMFLSIPVIATLRIVFVRLQRAHAQELVTPHLEL